MIKVNSRNFGFLKQYDPNLERLGALAERFFQEDPNTSLIKTRQFAELLAGHAAAHTNQITTDRDTQIEVLNILSRNGIISKEVADAFHLIRKRGNRANHDFSGTHNEALSSLKFSRALGVWFHQTFGDKNFKPRPFMPPPDPEEMASELHEQLEDLRRQLDESLSEAEHATRLAEEEAELRLSAEERASKESEERTLWEAMAQEAEETKAELLVRLTTLQASHAVQAPPQDIPLDIDEADTRALIDSQLRDAGWKADSQNLRYSRGTRPSNTPIAIAEWPTESGPVDYALFTEGKCIALVEAKRHSKDVPGVLAQAKRYARDLTIDPEQLAAGAPFRHGVDSF